MDALLNPLKFYRAALWLVLFLPATLLLATSEKYSSDEQLRAAMSELEAKFESRYLDVAAICNGRLTLTSGTAVTTSDVTGATSVYFTPYQGAKISLYDGTRWKLYAFSELSLALGTLTSGANYDVFLYDNAGALTLELSTAWTNDTTRADAISLQDGIYVKTTATTRRYLGTLRTTATTTTEDSYSRRFLWNMCGQVRRLLVGRITTNSWSYASTSAWRATAGNTTDGQGRVALVLGIAGEIEAQATSMMDSSANLNAVNTIGIDSTTAETVTVRHQPSQASVRHWLPALLHSSLGIGYHYVQSVELCVGGGPTAVVFYGQTLFHSITAQIRG